MDPRRTSQNTLLVQVQDADGEPYDPPATPVVALRSDDLDLGPVVVPRAGEWRVQVGIALSRFDSPVTTVTPVRP